MRLVTRIATAAMVAAAAGSVVIGAPVRDAAAFMLPKDRAKLDMSKYTVKDPNASFLDVKKRMALLRKTDDPQLIAIRNRLQMGFSCRSYLDAPVLDGKLSLPSFYHNPDEWRIAARPMLDFENMMSNLSGAWLASGDPYYGKCIAKVLTKWAKADALSKFQFSLAQPQAWYGIESMIFSAALAYSTVTGLVDIPEDEDKAIKSWLHRIAEHHFSIKGNLPSCCNNHFYRRALYMTIVGVITDDDKMFQTGLTAPIAALDDLDSRGAFQLAMKRGWRALHYQNYALQYLVAIMQVAYRQGYDMFKLKSRTGETFADAVAFLFRALADPYSIKGLPPGEQDFSFTADDQYFAWMEIWLHHFDNPEMERFVRLQRPIFSRDVGGYATLEFKKPESPGAIARREKAKLAERNPQTADQTGYVELKEWRETE